MARQLDGCVNRSWSGEMLVGNKIDVGAREVSVEEATEFARKQAMMFIETSAKSRAGIRQAFEELVRARRRGTLCARALHSVAHAHPVPAASRRRCKRCSRRPISSTPRTDDQRLGCGCAGRVGGGRVLVLRRPNL